MSRRLSGIRFAHRMHDSPDPTAAARVITVWEGIRPTHGAPPDQAAPLMAPELWDVIDRCPTTKTWKTGKPLPEPDLAGLRDRALLLVGFVAALRRSELTALTVDQIAEQPNGLVLAVAPRPTRPANEQSWPSSPERGWRATAPSPPSRPCSPLPASTMAPSSEPCPPATGQDLER